jgi:two-component system probable response regulator PhcQ
MTNMNTNSNDNGYAILYVDDEEQALKYFRKEFKHEYPILAAPGAAQALAILEKEHARVGVLLTDHRMSGQTGVELLTRARQAWPNIVRILVTAYSDMASAVEAVNSGAVYKYLTKPVDPVYLGQVLREAMDVFLERRRKDALLEEKLSALQQMMVNDRVKSMAVLASGISHHVRNSMTAITCYFEELDASGGAPPDGYIAELRDLAKKERDQLARIVTSVTQHVALPEVRIADEADLAEVVRQAASDTGLGPAGIALDVSAGPVTLKVDRAAIVKMLRKLFDYAALHAAANGPAPSLPAVSLSNPSNPSNGPVRVSVEAPVAHWNTTGARVLIRGSGPAWSDQDIASLFTPFAVAAAAPSSLGPDLLDTFRIALAHGGDLITHKSAPLGPGFELRLPLDPAQVRRPIVDESCLAGARP